MNEDAIAVLEGQLDRYQDYLDQQHKAKMSLLEELDVINAKIDTIKNTMQSISESIELLKGTV